MSLIKQYLVLEGSLSACPLDEERGARRVRLEKFFNELGRRHARCLRTPIDFTSGTVFQALLRDPERIPLLLEELDHGLHTESYHLGLGWGELTTALSGRVRRMDGPAFDQARLAREDAEDESALVRVRGFGDPHDQILNGQLLLLGQVCASWKPKQRETIALMRRLGRRMDVAAARGVLPSTVTRSLEGAFFSGVEGVQESLTLLLIQFTTQATEPSAEGRPK